METFIALSIVAAAAVALAWRTRRSLSPSPPPDRGEGCSGGCSGCVIAQVGSADCTPRPKQASGLRIIQ